MWNSEKKGAQITVCGAMNPQSAIGNLKCRGFTLVEIVITIVLVGILSGLAAMIIMQGVRTYGDEQARSNVHYQARLAMERMGREIRQIRSRADIATMLNTNLRFMDVNGSNVGFSWDNPTQKLNRWNGVGNDVLASGITAFTFSYYQQDGVTVATPANVWVVEMVMTAQQGADSLPMRSRVHPRNFQ